MIGLALNIVAFSIVVTAILMALGFIVSLIDL